MSVLAILDFMAMMPFEKAKQSHSALLIMLGGCGLVSLDLRQRVFRHLQE